MGKKANFATIILELRENSGLSQRQLAGYLDISQSAITKYENNLRTPTADVIIKYSMYFDISADILLGIKEY